MTRMDDLPEVDHDALWDACGSQNWDLVERILKDTGYDLEDLGMLAVMARDGEE
jgi:hypothetical protein